MKKTFYNPHTVISDITNLDKKWLDKQNREKPYDLHYAYLEALRLIGQGSKTEAIEKIGELLFKSSNQVRVSSLLDRATSQTKSSLNSISTIEIKSKKSEEMAKLSPLLMGLLPLVSDNVAIDKVQLKDSVADNISDIGEPPTSLTLDVIDITEINDDAIGVSSTKSDKKNKVAESISSLSTTDIEEEEEEEEEYVSNRVMLQNDEVIVNQISDPVEAAQDGLEIIENKERETVDPVDDVLHDDDLPSVSDSVQIEHSKFTSWLKGLPRLNEKNQLPESENKFEIISEPYAKILVDQGHKSDAIRMYEQLMLKYPEKSSFFADQIKKLK